MTQQDLAFAVSENGIQHGHSMQFEEPTWLYRAAQLLVATRFATLQGNNSDAGVWLEYEVSKGTDKLPTDLDGFPSDNALSS